MLTTFKTLALCLLFLNPALAAEVPAEHRSHCDKWENGRCIEGALTKLAVAMNAKNRSETCDQVCKEGCPNCEHCGLCIFCAVYSNEACVGVPYFTDRETCGVEKTKDCCDLCKVQCQAKDGVCSNKGFCNGGTPETDLMSYCVEKTTEDECKACGQ